MKNLALLFISLGIFFTSGCTKEKKSERFLLLTGHEWTTESLLANGVDAGGPGGLLEEFNGDARFNEDETGYFGTYTGTWRFSTDETEITIVTAEMPLPITCDIIELTTTKFKITTLIDNQAIPGEKINISMTFIAK